MCGVYGKRAGHNETGNTMYAIDIATATTAELITAEMHIRFRAVNHGTRSRAMANTRDAIRAEIARRNAA